MNYWIQNIGWTLKLVRKVYSKGSWNHGDILPTKPVFLDGLSVRLCVTIGRSIWVCIHHPTTTKNNHLRCSFCAGDLKSYKSTLPLLEVIQTYSCFGRTVSWTGKRSMHRRPRREPWQMTRKRKVLNICLLWNWNTSRFQGGGNVKMKHMQYQYWQTYIYIHIIYKTIFIFICMKVHVYTCRYSVIRVLLPFWIYDVLVGSRELFGHSLGVPRSIVLSMLVAFKPISTELRRKGPKACWI